MFHLFLLIYLSLFFSLKTSHQPLNLLTVPSKVSQPTFLLKVQQNVYKITIKTQQQYINISILLWQNISVQLDHLRAYIQRYEVQSVHVLWDPILLTRCI